MKNFDEWYNEHLEQHEIDPLFYVSSIASEAWRAGWNAALEAKESFPASTNTASHEIPSDCKVCPIGDYSKHGSCCNNHIHGSQPCRDVINSFARYFGRC